MIAIPTLFQDCPMAQGSKLFMSVDPRLLDRYSTHNRDRRRRLPPEMIRLKAFLCTFLQALAPREYTIATNYVIPDAPDKPSQDDLAILLNVAQSNISFRSLRIKRRLKLYHERDSICSETFFYRNLVRLLSIVSQNRDKGVSREKITFEDVQKVLHIRKTYSQSRVASISKLPVGRLRSCWNRVKRILNDYLSSHPDDCDLRVVSDAMNHVELNWNELAPVRSAEFRCRDDFDRAQYQQLEDDGLIPENRSYRSRLAHVSKFSLVVWNRNGHWEAFCGTGKACKNRISIGLFPLSDQGELQAARAINQYYRDHLPSRKIPYPEAEEPIQ